MAPAYRRAIWLGNGLGALYGFVAGWLMLMGIDPVWPGAAMIALGGFNLACVLAGRGRV